MIKISIGIPHYNRSKDLIKLLLDIADQETKPFEILIQDNLSDIEHINRIEDFLKTFKHKVIFNKNKTNVGMMRNINLVIDNVKGDYLAICHSDDRISPMYISEFSKAIKENLNFNIYTCNGTAINEKVEITDDFRIFNSNGILKKHEGINNLWRKGYFIYLSVLGVSVYKSTFIKKNKLDPSYETEADLHNALKFLHQENIFYIDLPLYFATVDGTNTSADIRKSREKSIKYTKNVIKIIEEYQLIFKDIFFYPDLFKSLMFAQLLIKSDFSIEESLNMLHFKRYEFPKIMIMVMYIAVQLGFKRIGSIFNRSSLLPYLPKIH